MDMRELKRKLRELKRMEQRIRVLDCSTSHGKTYVWDTFFSTKNEDATVKHPLKELLTLDRLRFKEIYEEYFYCVYFQMYKENGMDFDGIQNPLILSYFGLAPGATADQVKARFRELAQKYHPDHGGTSEKMIEILEAYRRAMDGAK